MRGKILYLPVASLPEDPLMGCTMMTDVRPHHHRCAMVPLPFRRGGLALAVIAGAAYVAACVLWPETLWALPAAVAVGLWIFGEVSVP